MGVVTSIINIITCNKCRQNDNSDDEIIECHTCQYCFNIVKCANAESCKASKYLISRSFPRNDTTNILFTKYYIIKNGAKSRDLCIICTLCYTQLKKENARKACYSNIEYKQGLDKINHLNDMLEELFNIPL